MGSNKLVRSNPGRILGTLAVLALVVGVTLLQKRGLLPAGTSTPPTAPPAPGPTATQTPERVPPGASPTKQIRGTSIRIGSWNIEWLGKPEERSGPATGIAQSADDLAAYITAAKVSVLCVQEIVASVNSRPIRSHEIEAALAAIKSTTGQNWEYELFPGRQDGDQLTGVLWDTAVVTALDSSGGEWDQRDTPWALPIPKGRSAQGSSLWNRPPHAMKFSCGAGKSDFVVVVLHMKADYQGAFAAHRDDEARALVAKLADVRSTFRDDDVVLAGDTNCTQPDEPALSTLSGAGYADTNAAHQKTHWRGGEMDKILVPLSQPEFADSGLEVMSDEYLRSNRLTAAQFKERLSDHYMVVTTIRVEKDDD